MHQPLDAAQWQGKQVEMFCDVHELIQSSNSWLCESESAVRLIVSQILEDPESVEEAVESCLSIARSTVRSFRTRGEFGSWILRLAIDEASRMVRRNESHLRRGPTSALLSNEAANWQQWWLDL